MQAKNGKKLHVTAFITHAPVLPQPLISANQRTRNDRGHQIVLSGRNKQGIVSSMRHPVQKFPHSHSLSCQTLGRPVRSTILRHLQAQLHQLLRQDPKEGPCLHELLC